MNERGIEKVDSRSDIRQLIVLECPPLKNYRSVSVDFLHHVYDDTRVPISAGNNLAHIVEPVTVADQQNVSVLEELDLVLIGYVSVLHPEAVNHGQGGIHGEELLR